MRKIRLQMLTSPGSQSQEMAELDPKPTCASGFSLGWPHLCDSPEVGSGGHAWAGLWRIKLSHRGLFGRPRDSFLPACLLLETESRRSFRSEIWVNAITVKWTFNPWNCLFRGATECVTYRVALVVRDLMARLSWGDGTFLSLSLLKGQL